MSDIELQFDKLSYFIANKNDYSQLAFDLSEFDIDDRLKSWLVDQAGTYIAVPIMFNQYHCFNDSQNKNNLVNFLFSFGQDTFESFLSNQEIDILF